LNKISCDLFFEKFVRLIDYGMVMQKARKSKSGLRGFTRLYAVQMMYRQQMENLTVENLIYEAEHNPEVIVSEDYSVSTLDLIFLKTLISFTFQHLPEIDKLIEKYLSDKWDFSRLDPVMQSLLRLGTCELKFIQDAPMTVVFNEYIEIAKAFFEKKDASFANGILNSIAKDGQ